MIGCLSYNVVWPEFSLNDNRHLTLDHLNGPAIFFRYGGQINPYNNTSNYQIYYICKTATLCPRIINESFFIDSENKDLELRTHGVGLLTSPLPFYFLSDTASLFYLDILAHGQTPFTDVRKNKTRQDLTLVSLGSLKDINQWQHQDSATLNLLSFPFPSLPSPCTTSHP